MFNDSRRVMNFSFMYLTVQQPAAAAWSLSAAHAEENKWGKMC